MTTIDEDSFKLLPKELAELILSDLEPEDLARSSSVNHHWRKLAVNDLLWRKFFNDYQRISEPLKLAYGVSKDFRSPKTTFIFLNKIYIIPYVSTIITDDHDDMIKLFTLNSTLILLPRNFRCALRVFLRLER